MIFLKNFFSHVNAQRLTVIVMLIFFFSTLDSFPGE